MTPAKPPVDNTWLTLFGLIMVLAGIGFTIFKLVPAPYGFAWAVLGALMVSPNKVISALRTWKNGQS